MPGTRKRADVRSLVHARIKEIPLIYRIISQIPGIDKEKNLHERKKPSSGFFL